MPRVDSLTASGPEPAGVGFALRADSDSVAPPSSRGRGGLAPLARDAIVLIVRIARWPSRREYCDVRTLAELRERRGLRVPADTGSRARDARRGGAVPLRPRPAHARDRLRSAEPVRGLPRGAVRARQPGLRPVARDEVPLVRPARRARLPDPRRPPRQERARDRRRRHSAQPDLSRRDRADGASGSRLGAAAAPPRGGRAIRARGASAPAPARRRPRARRRRAGRRARSGDLFLRRGRRGPDPSGRGSLVCRCGCW